MPVKSTKTTLESTKRSPKSNSKSKPSSPKASSPDSKTSKVGSSTKVGSPRNIESKVSSPKNKSKVSSPKSSSSPKSTSHNTKVTKPTTPKGNVAAKTTSPKKATSPKNKTKSKASSTTKEQPSTTPIIDLLQVTSTSVTTVLESNNNNNKKSEKIKMWQECIDPKTKKVYYYHSETKRSSWTKPDDFDSGGDDGQRRQSAVVDDDELFMSPNNNDNDNSEDNQEDNQNPYFRDLRLSNAERPDPSVFDANSLPPDPAPELKKKGSVGFNVGSTVAAAQKFNKNLRANIQGGEYNPHQNEELEQPRTRTRSWSGGGGGGGKAKSKPPSAAHVPVDALARAGERSSKWLEYIKKHLLMTEHVKDAGIFDLRNCARWAATKDFLPRHYHIVDSTGTHHGINEAASTVFLMKSGSLPKHGLRFNGVMYSLESAKAIKASKVNGLSRWAIHGTRELPRDEAVDPHWKWAGGIYLVRTSRAVVIATYDKSKANSKDICKAAVDGLAKFMTDYAC